MQRAGDWNSHNRSLYEATVNRTNNTCTLNPYRSIYLKLKEMNEWKDIKGYEGLYQVSRSGEIRSFHASCTSGKTSVLNRKLTKHVSGYVTTILTKDKRNRGVRVHRLVAETFIPNPYNLPDVNHKDGNKRNNNVSNLEWVTPSQNVKHTYDTLGRIGLRGEKNHFALLTEKDVLRIRDVYENTDRSLSSLGLEYNVTLQAISQIVNRKKWKHI